MILSGKQTLVQNKIKPFVHQKIKNFLGELDEDLADFVLEHLRDRKGANDLVDGLEPVSLPYLHGHLIEISVLICHHFRSWLKTQNPSSFNYGANLFSKVWHSGRVLTLVL